MTQKLQGYGQPQDWDDETYYPIGQSVVDRGGIWRALVQNRNSEPISGNTNWTLVAGIPYTDTIVDPVTLAAMTNTAPVATLVPAPGAGLILVLPFALNTWVSEGDVWAGASISFGVQWVDTSGATISNLPQDLQTAAPVADIYVGIAAFDQGDLNPTPTPSVIDAPIVLTKFTAGDAPITGGSRSLGVRTYYTIRPGASGVFTSTFFSITAVDQGTQTITVNGDATDDLAVGSTFAVVGSTGNNGTYTTVSTLFTTSGTGTTDAIGAVDQGAKTFTVTGSDVTALYPAGSITTVAGSTGNDGDYTVVSATLNAGDTDIIVVEAIPDATADGTLEEPSVTEVVTVQALPDATADGWVEVA